MPIKEIPTRDELILYEIIKHPVLCGEFINNLDKLPHEKRFEFHDYQKEMLCDFNPYISLCCGRTTGKTVVLSNLITWLMINKIFSIDYINYHVPGKNHVEPVFTALVRLFRLNSLLKHFLPPKSGVNASDLIIKLDNGTSLLCRIAGQSGTGVAVIGLHSPFVICDEAGYYPYQSFLEMNPTLNTETLGARMIVSGVPTGLREKNVLWQVDQEDNNYTKHRISNDENPRRTEEDKLKAIEAYGGEDSDDFIHLWHGLHGKPVFSLFSRETMSISDYPIYKMEFDGQKLGNNLVEYINRLAILPGLPYKSSVALFGIDLGYSEPTAIFIMYMDTSGKLKFHAKLQLNTVNFHVQERIIDFLDSRYEPAIIGIDESVIGKPVVQRLLEDNEFMHKKYKEKLVPISFSSNIIIGTDTSGEELKMKAKPLSVSVLQEYTLNSKILYSSTDMETIVELERMTYTKNNFGDIIYKTLTERGGKKGEDHFTAALLCGTLAHYLKNEALEFNAKPKKLFQPRWLIGG